MSKKNFTSQAQNLINQAAGKTKKDTDKHIHKDVYNDKQEASYNLRTAKNKRNIHLQCLLDQETSDLLKDFAATHGTSKNEVVIQAIRKFINEY